MARIAALLFTALLLTISVTLYAQTRTRVVWAYASVYPSDEGARICYYTSDGCRFEIVRAPDAPAIVPFGTPSQTPTQRAMSRAISQLGANGWEMVDRELAVNAAWDVPIFHFKRAE